MSTTEEPLVDDPATPLIDESKLGSDPLTPAEANEQSRYAVFIPNTHEGEQLLKPRSETTAKELLREVGSVLRMSETEAAQLGDLPEDPDEDQTMIINMGPQHPSTHGV
ncbi:MAG: hypothetical protein AAGG08_16135, partial [Actinomycetota bacterium]